MLEIYKPPGGLIENLWYLNCHVILEFSHNYFQLLKTSGTTDILADFWVPLSEPPLGIAQLRSLPKESRDYHIKDS